MVNRSSHHALAFLCTLDGEFVRFYGFVNSLVCLEAAKLLHSLTKQAEMFAVKTTAAWMNFEGEIIIKINGDIFIVMESSRVCVNVFEKLFLANGHNANALRCPHALLQMSI